MSLRHIVELLLLSAIWGASFIFMRVAAPEFGALNTASLRLIIAGLTLSPLLFLVAKPYLAKVENKKTVIAKVALVGFGNSVIPFILFAYAALNIDAGLASIINATTPLWGALFGILILSNRLGRSGWLGLLLGFIGVYILSQHKINGGMTSDLLAILAVITATSLYGLSTNFSKRYLCGVPPLMIASGTMASSALLMVPFLLTTELDLFSVSSQAWLAVLALGTVSTGFAYVLFYPW